MHRALTLLAILAAAADAPVDACTSNPATPAELRAALAAAGPGEVICIDGVYGYSTLADRFEITGRSGTAANPITLRGSGPGSTVLEGPGWNASGSFYVLYLSNSHHWRLSGFTVREGNKGIVLDESTFNILDDLVIHSFGQEAVHFRTHSSDNVISNSSIADTGRLIPEFGEGVYVGSAQGNWNVYTGGQPDRSDRNQVLDNSFGPDIRSECIDIKKGTVDNLVAGNHFEGTALPAQPDYVDSLVDIKGDRNLVIGNTAVENPSDPKLIKGLAVVRTKVGKGKKGKVYGNDNTFEGNQITLIDGTYGVSIAGGTSGNIVCDDNLVSGAQVSNIPTVDCAAPPPMCVPPGEGQACTASTECCTGVGNCTGGKPSRRVCR